MIVIAVSFLVGGGLLAIATMFLPGDLGKVVPAYISGILGGFALGVLLAGGSLADLLS